MITNDTEVAFDDPLPQSADVVVIGAGVIGMFTAWFLNRAGASVVVCEKGRVAGEQSGRNWGWIRQQGRDEAELPIMMRSIQLWEEMAQTLETDIGFRRGGVAYLAETRERYEKLRQWLPIAESHGLDSRDLSESAVATLINSGSPQWVGGVYTPSDARAEPFVAVPAVAGLVQAEGVRLKENCAVRSITSDRGRVSAVVTESGAVQTSRVVCCAGAWSRLFLSHLGFRLPQLTVRATVARTSAAPEIFAGNAAGSDLAFRRRLDGGYSMALSDHMEHFVSGASFRDFRTFIPALRASWHQTRLRPGQSKYSAHTRGRWRADETTPFERVRVLHPEPSPWAIREIQARVARRLPSLGDIELTQSWAGMIDATPDMVPVIDELPELHGFHLATGFSGHGFGIGPGAGEVIAGMVMGRAPQFDLDRFRYARFFDGTPLKLGPII